jgi:hypothetical protein
MLRTILSSLIVVGTVGAATAQTVYVPERQYDYGTTQTIPSYESHRNFTGTMGEKWMGPGKTTGDSFGPDGTPGNGAPSKQDGGR